VIVTRDFREWHGLPEQASVEDLATISIVDAERRATGWLGESKRRTEWLPATVTGYDQGVRLWVEQGLNRIVLLDVERPSLKTELDVLIDAIGAPVAKLDSYLGTFRLQDSEWIFASRGLTLYVNPETGALLRLAVYPATDLEKYRHNLRLDLQMTRLPSARSN
jgi:hypothetical protein